jgi:anti-sigma regulatory factor (Ser/Thr protein kinase)
MSLEQPTATKLLPTDGRTVRAVGGTARARGGRPARGGAGTVGGNAPVISPESIAPVPALPRHQQGADGPAHADPWPLRSYLILGAYESAVPCARLHTRLVLLEWGLPPELAGLAELAVSELVTNSQQASAGLDGSRFGGQHVPGRPPVRLWLHADSERILVEVWDASRQLPVKRHPQADDEHGRGLLLVETLSTQCSVYRLEGTSGKVTWAMLECHGT